METARIKLIIFKGCEFDRLQRFKCRFSKTNAWGAGDTVVMHVSLTTVTRVQISASCSYLIKVALVMCWKSVLQFVSSKYRRFSPGSPISSCSNTGPMNGGPYWTSRENSLGS